MSGDGTFRQRANNYSNRSSPGRPAMRPEEKMEQILQGGWIEHRSENFEYRLFTKEERLLAGEQKVLREADLSGDQLEVFKTLVHWYAHDTESTPYITLGGYAGTGKSTLVSVFARLHRSQRIGFCAFTGKAANVLKNKLRDAGVDNPSFVGTVHRMMYTTRTDASGRPVWQRNEELDFDLIIVDEASMISEQIFNDMLSYQIPILAVGDHGQLSPIGEKFNLMQDPMLKLENIHRQAEGSPIISLSKYIREEGELPDRYEANEFVRFVHPQEMRRRLEDLYHRDLDGPALSNIAILCYTNKKRRMANNLVREMRWGAKEDEDPRAGDLLICLRNHGSILFNGMRSRIQAVHENKDLWYWSHVVFDADDMEMKGNMFRPQFNRNTTISYFDEVKDYGFPEKGWTKAMGLLFDYGYCLTVHKSQGSSFKNVFMLYERPNMVDRDEFRRWLYTSVTRSSEQLSIVIR